MIRIGYRRTPTRPSPRTRRTSSPGPARPAAATAPAPPRCAAPTSSARADAVDRSRGTVTETARIFEVLHWHKVGMTLRCCSLRYGVTNPAALPLGYPEWLQVQNGWRQLSWNGNQCEALPRTRYLERCYVTKRSGVILGRVTTQYVDQNGTNLTQGSTRATLQSGGNTPSSSVARIQR